MNAQQLNQVATLLGTDSKELVFSTCIKFLVDEGMELKDAVDAVLGEGAYARIGEGVYAKLAG
jgi:hypothetical protein